LNVVSATRSTSRARISSAGLLESDPRHREHRVERTVSRETSPPRAVVSATFARRNDPSAGEALPGSIDRPSSVLRNHISHFLVLINLHQSTWNTEMYSDEGEALALVVSHRQCDQLCVPKSLILPCVDLRAGETAVLYTCSLTSNITNFPYGICRYHRE
jgi:hypothetical protein